MNGDGIAMLHVVTCKSCTFVYAEPRRTAKIMPCGHTYCCKCMTMLADQQDFLCPVCRKRWGDDLSKLVTNHYVMDIAKEPAYLDKALAADIQDEVVCLKTELLRLTTDIAAGVLDPITRFAKIQELKARGALVLEQEEVRKKKLLEEVREAKEMIAILDRAERRLQNIND